MKAQQALEHWRQKGLLSEEKVRELEVSLRELDEEGPSRGIVLFAGVGAVLVGLGILLFISSNWRAMGPVVRGTVLLGTYAAIVAGAYGLQRKGFERLAEAMWFLATLSFGANIFFLAQIFNFTLTFWQGPLVWLLGVLAMGFARRRAIYGHAAIPLLLLFLGWLGGGAGWFMDDQFEFLFADQGLRPLLPLLGTGLIALALLFRRHTGWAFLERGARTWGVLLLAVPLLVVTADGGLMEEAFSTAWTTKQWVLALGALLLVAAAIGSGAVRTMAARTVLAGAAGLSAALVVSPGGTSALGALADEVGLVFLLLVCTVFALAMLTVWLGLRVTQPKLVNAGMASLAILIVIQYFAISFGLLHRSLVFVAGGLFILALAFFMERARRRLLRRMEVS